MSTNRIMWILRISCALCFIGHGAWGIIAKTGWLPFFTVCGIPENAAWVLMRVIGAMDITLGIWILARPTRFVMVYMTVWAVWTALLRPLAGMGWWEFFERGGNYGAPLAFLILSGGITKMQDWFAPVRVSAMTPETKRRLIMIVKTCAAFLLIGHGGFGAFQQKEMLISHWQAVGLPPAGVDPARFITAVGWFEILLGVCIFLKPGPKLALFILGWKLGTEFLYIIHGPVIWDLFEFIERWGSYGLPLVIYSLTRVKVLAEEPGRGIEVKIPARA